jgi:CHAT domain-containing protein
MLACGVACGRNVRPPASLENPETSFHHAQEALQRGDDLVNAQAEAEHGVKRYLSSSPEWARKFRILEAEVMLVRGNDYAQVLSLLDAEAERNGTRDSIIKVLALKSAALARLQQFDEADLILRQAEALCDASEELTCGEVFRARGVLLLQRGKPERAKRFFEKTVVFARLHRDQFLEATALLNLGLGALRDQHFDEAVDWTDEAYRVSSALGAGTVAEKALGNLAWDYYYLGDFENALDKSLKAAKLATQAGADTDRLTWITAAGNVYASRGDLAGATRSYREALNLANKTRGKEAMYDAYRALALVSVESGELAEGRKCSDLAFDIAHNDHNRLDELYPILVRGMIAARSHDGAEAERVFREVETDHKNNASLKFRAQYSLARLYEDQGRHVAADRLYQRALATIEASWAAIHRIDSKLPFSNNARHVYDDYVHFLVASKKTDDALRWGDFSRARTLKEGLGLLPKGGSVGPPPLDAQQISRRAGGTILFYWLGDKQSYLWAITPQKTSLFTLPARKEIEDHMHRYSEALKVQGVLALADRDGESLYSTLVSPAQASLKKDAEVFVIPDGDLNNLNFETLPVSEPNTPETKSHFWIDDVTIANASSLRVLAAAHVATRKPDRTLLIVGNSVSPTDKYPELPHAAVEVKSVASHFPEAKLKMLTREGATPSAYLASRPEQFSYIHFVAHGMASRLSPLDSAIVLSKDSARDDSFKLYARDIIDYSKNNPLQADLVTISACYSSGERSYSGEGLVGLSWAFLRAGAHNVVAALWDVSDVSTMQLMDKFYDSLNKGARPDAALRVAKLSLLHSNKFHDPYYWAPFQLYARLD